MKKLILTIGMVCLFMINNQAQKSKDTIVINENSKKLTVSLNGKSDATIYVDEKEYVDGIVGLLDAIKIGSDIELLSKEKAIEIPSGEKVIKKYNKEAALLVKTRMKDNPSGTPVIVIDDKIETIEALKKISPDNIYHIEILHNKEMQKKYGTENGVILVTTKKKKL